jgi:hypothetical protein
VVISLDGFWSSDFLEVEGTITEWKILISFSMKEARGSSVIFELGNKIKTRIPVKTVIPPKA